MRSVLATTIVTAMVAFAGDRETVTWLTVVDVDGKPAANVRVDFKCNTGEGGGFTSDTGSFEVLSGNHGPCLFVFIEGPEKRPQKTVTLDVPRPNPPVRLKWKVGPPPPSQLRP